MKGLMVPLLMLVMTGIVVGQQPNSNQFGDNSSGPDTTGGRTNFGPTQTDESQIKPIDLSVSDDDIRGLLEPGAELQSEIAPSDPKTKLPLPREVVSGVTLVHERNLGNSSLPIRTIEGENGGGGVLRFGLNEADLQSLENNKKLRFTFNPADRGKFKLVSFYYKPATASNNETNFGPSTAFGPTPDNEPTSRQTFGTTPFGQNSSLGFIPPPGPEAVPGDVDFEGPVMPLPGNAVTQNDRPIGWDPIRRSPTNPLFDQNLNNETNFPTQSNDQVANPIDWDAIRLRQQTNELLRQQEQARLARIGQRDTDVGASPWQTPSSITPTGLTPQQIAERVAEIERKRQLDAYELHLKERDQVLAAKEAAIEKSRREAEYLRYVEAMKTSPSSEVPPVYAPTGPIAGIDYRTKTPVVERPPRSASNTDIFRSPIQSFPQRQTDSGTRPTIRNDMVASMPGPIRPGSANDPAAGGVKKGPGLNDAEATKERRAEGFIYFLLLCSLGLNIYLAIISRGFYVRYNELADELRETFTATM